ncbi:MAG: chitobiase/beta-hexosaminidase C-terminal domain-containing protein [Prevotellaceae bacterium]|nr:chitobiase/beta-hexosaminidase C-terminal domain-containing protein [Prevotellaceae bacterium]
MVALFATMFVSVKADDVLAYTISFQNEVLSDGTSAKTTANFVADLVASGEEYISSCTATDKTYVGIGGIKLSSASVSGFFKLALSDAGQVHATKIVVNAAAWTNASGITDQGATIAVNEIDTVNLNLTAEAADYTFVLDGSSLEELYVQSVSRRCYIYTISVYVADNAPTKVATPVIMYDGTDVTGTEVDIEGLSVNLTALCATEGAIIRYNDYGNVESWNDNVTTVPVYEVYSPADVTLYFKAFKLGLEESEEVSVIFHFTEVIAPEDRVATPVILPEDTDVEGESVEVTITCATDDSDIFYTLDGTEPFAMSSPYADAIVLTETTTVRAKAMNNFSGLHPSLVAEKTYTFTSGLNNVKELAFISYSENGVLKIVSKSGKTVEVITVAGQSIATSTTIEGVTELSNLPLNQVLIVKVGNESARVIVK